MIFHNPKNKLKDSGLWNLRSSQLRHLDTDLSTVMRSGDAFDWKRINFVLEAICLNPHGPVYFRTNVCYLYYCIYIYTYYCEIYIYIHNNCPIYKYINIYIFMCQFACFPSSVLSMERWIHPNKVWHALAQCVLGLSSHIDLWAKQTYIYIRYSHSTALLQSLRWGEKAWKNSSQPIRTGPGAPCRNLWRLPIAHGSSNWRATKHNSSRKRFCTST